MQLADEASRVLGYTGSPSEHRTSEKTTEPGSWHVGTWCPTEPTCVARAKGQESMVQGHEVTEAAETWAQGASETTVRTLAFLLREMRDLKGPEKTEAQPDVLEHQPGCCAELTAGDQRPGRRSWGSRRGDDPGAQTTAEAEKAVSSSRV